MKNILVPSDGSENAGRAIDFAIGLAKQYGATLHLLNVQHSVGAVSQFVPAKDVKDFHREEGMKALAPGLKRAEAAAVPAKPHIGVGHAGPTIVAFAHQLGCDHVVMGTRGLGSAVGTLLGSTANNLLEQINVPVTLVK